MEDRRQHERIELSVTCNISAGGMRPSALDGVTENISRNGLLFEIKGTFDLPIIEVGDFLGVDLLLPERRTFGKKSLRCRGSVVRVLKTAGGARIALSIQQMTFHSLGQAARRKPTLADWDEIAFRA